MSLEDVPEYLSDFLGMNEGTAQVLIGIIVMFTFVIPVMIVAKGKHQMPILITMFLALGFLTGIGWFPFWFLIAAVVMLVVGLANGGSKMIFGK